MYMHYYKDVFYACLYAFCNTCLHLCVIENKIIKQKSFDCQYVLFLLLHEIESIFVQRTNEVPIHRSFPCPMKGLFLMGVGFVIDNRVTDSSTKIATSVIFIDHKSNIKDYKNVCSVK